MTKLEVIRGIFWEISNHETEAESLISIFELKLRQEKKTNFVKDFSMLWADANRILSQNRNLMTEKANQASINLIPTSTTMDFVEVNSHITNIPYNKIDCRIESIKQNPDSTLMRNTKGKSVEKLFHTSWEELKPPQKLNSMLMTESSRKDT